MARVWQTFFDFGTEKDRRGEQFSQAMNYVFVDSVEYLFRRVTRRARPAITLITEEQMQQAWSRGGNTPSVCDWVLVAGKYCLLVDATNHWLDEKVAQGFADAEDYRADTEEAFVNNKFLQLKSTIELLAEKGWEDCTFDDQTVYVGSEWRRMRTGKRSHSAATKACSMVWASLTNRWLTNRRRRGCACSVRPPSSVSPSTTVLAHRARWTDRGRAAPTF